mgnify:CR=1 FL=1
MPRVEICLSDEEAEAVGSMAAASGLSTDQLLRQSVASFTRRHDRDKGRRARRETIRRGMRIQDEMRAETAGAWDAIAVLRTLRAYAPAGQAELEREIAG